MNYPLELYSNRRLSPSFQLIRNFFRRNFPAQQQGQPKPFKTEDFHGETNVGWRTTVRVNYWNFRNRVRHGIKENTVSAGIIPPKDAVTANCRPTFFCGHGFFTFRALSLSRRVALIFLGLRVLRIHLYLRELRIEVEREHSSLEFKSFITLSSLFVTRGSRAQLSFRWTFEISMSLTLSDRERENCYSRSRTYLGIFGELMDPSIALELYLKNWKV